MRFLHLADLHLGKVVNGFPLIEDQHVALEHLLEDIAAQPEGTGIDAVVLAGDLYDRASPSGQAVAVMDWFFTQLAEAGIPCLAVAGNHDSAERVAYAGSLMRSRGIYVSPAYNGGICPIELEDEFGTIVFWLMPFLKPLDVRHAFPEHAEEIGRDYTTALKVALETCDVDASVRNVLVTHQFVTYGAEQTERSDSEIFVGGLDNVDGHIFDAFDYVALGHIHRAQRIGRDAMRYAGSLMKYSASEADHEKTATVVELGPKGTVDISTLPIRPPHDLRMLCGTVDELTERDGTDPVSLDYIHAVLTDETPLPSHRARLREAYPHLMSFEYQRTGGPGKRDSTQLDAPTSAPAAADDLSPVQAFERFFEEQNGTAPTEGQRQAIEQAMTKAAAAGESDGEKETE